MLEFFQMSARIWWANTERQQEMFDVLQTMSDRWVDACVSELTGAPSSTTVAHDLLRSYRMTRQ